MARPPSEAPPFPSTAEILRFIEESEGTVGKREIARAFKIRGPARIELRETLKQLAEDGLIDRGHERGVRPKGELPPVSVIEVIEADEDGRLLARPVAWEGDGPPPRIEISPERRSSGPALGPTERVLARLAKSGEGYEAKIIRRLGFAPNRLVGVLADISGSLRLMPTNRRNKFDLLVPPDGRGGAKKGDLVLAETLPGRRLGLREARVLEVVGRFGDPRAASLVAITEREIPFDFASPALAEAEAAVPAELGARLDLRHVPFVTIDGAGARDFDDAVWAERDDAADNGGGWRIMVAIADVAHYVRPATALDASAHERGNSVYFPDRVVAMLPEKLSNDLCCLRPEEDRAAMVAELRLDKGGEKLDHRFHRALIRSRARLIYEDVQEARDSADRSALPEAARDRIGPLYGAWKALMRARARRAPLDLELPELKVVLDDQGRVAMIHPATRHDSHRLIEEFMIAANVAAAEELEHHQQPCMYRVHDAPDPEKVRALREFLRTLGLDLSLGQVIRPGLFNRLLAQVAESERAEVVNQAVLSAQSQAVYSPENLGHFGLALRRYAHFTSPIRRYSDLLVHRALIRGLGFGPDGLSDAEADRMAEIGEHVSNTERRAMAAERDAKDRYLAAHMGGRLEEEFDGTIAGVTRAGLFVRLAETGADGLVPIGAIGREFFVFDEEAQALVGERSGRVHRLGDKVRVRLKRADAITGSLAFELTDWPDHEPREAPRRGARRGPRPGARDGRGRGPRRRN